MLIASWKQAMVRFPRFHDEKGVAQMPSSSDTSERWFHPLIAQPQLTRRRLVLLSSGLVTLGAGLTIAGAQTPASPAPFADQLTGDEDAVLLLREAAAAMAALDSFRFAIETVRGQSTIFQGLSVETIEGSVRRPLDFTATVSVNVPFGSLDVTAVGLDGSAWVQDPLTEGEWIALEGGENIVALINPDTLILASVGLVQEATIDGNERVDGVETTVIAGVVNFFETAGQLGGDEVMLPTEMTAEPLPVLLWIDAEKRLLEIEVLGPILTSESDDVIRLIRFFDFNEPIEIERPDI